VFCLFVYLILTKVVLVKFMIRIVSEVCPSVQVETEGRCGGNVATLALNHRVRFDTASTRPRLVAR
jgi:hypothetical protein